MSKSKRNIILVFGFILITNLLFFPCNRINYDFFYRFEEKTNFRKTRWVSSEYVKVFFPLVISRKNKYKEYLKWESSALLMLEKKIEVREELEREWERLFEGRSTLLSDELLRDDKTIRELNKKKGLSQLDKVNIKIFEIDGEIEAIYEEKNKEFNAKFGYNLFYHQIKAWGFFIELGLLVLIGGLAYSTLVGIRAIRVAIIKKREIGVNRIKRRKTGIILILIGVGIPLALAPFVERGRVDFLDIGLDIEYKYFLFIGIILFLLGTGKVIFSFFPKDANPKTKSPKTLTFR